MKTFFLVCNSFFILSATAQVAPTRLSKAYSVFEKDDQLKFALSSLYVVEAKSGKVVFDKNARIGMAPASTQKVITSATALEMLGRDFRYQTSFYYDGEIKDSLLLGNIYIKGDGDPSLGSWRYTNTQPASIEKVLTTALHKAGINRQRGFLQAIVPANESAGIADGWIWQDIGNYYGTAPALLNWNENQYDLYMLPGKREGDTVKLVKTVPFIHAAMENHLLSGPKGSGDNAYLYFIPGSPVLQVKGTIPCCVSSFKISGAVPNGNSFAVTNIGLLLEQKGFGQVDASAGNSVIPSFPGSTQKLLVTHLSPSLDSLIYWFNKKSINLYGEALIKTIARTGNKQPGYQEGLQVLTGLWKEKGIDEKELNMVDGSGLSPLNRITTHAQVEVLKYAQKQKWFTGFYASLPEYNGMKMKSGTISGVKGFCGYHKAKDGKEYIFSFLVNNYNGSSSALVNKMYKVLNELK